MNVYPEKVCPWRAGVGVLGAAEVAGPSPGCRVYSAWQAGAMGVRPGPSSQPEISRRPCLLLRAQTPPICLAHHQSYSVPATILLFSFSNRLMCSFLLKRDASND